MGRSTKKARERQASSSNDKKEDAEQREQERGKKCKER